jgi:hypothetical protein
MMLRRHIALAVRFIVNASKERFEACGRVACNDSHSPYALGVACLQKPELR